MLRKIVAVREIEMIRSSERNTSYLWIKCREKEIEVRESYYEIQKKLSEMK